MALGRSVFAVGQVVQWKPTNESIEILTDFGTGRFEVRFTGEDEHWVANENELEGHKQMDRWGTITKIVTGRGNSERQSIEVKRNVTAGDRNGAIAAAITYAREIGLGQLLDDDDARVAVDVSYGEGVF
jgi:hypothetical protein